MEIFDALLLHALDAAAACCDEFALHLVLDWLHPGTIAIYMIQDHLVVVAPAGLLWEMAGLVGVEGGARPERLDENVILLFDGLCWVRILGQGIHRGGSGFSRDATPGGPDTLALDVHVSFLSLF